MDFAESHSKKTKGGQEEFLQLTSVSRLDKEGESLSEVERGLIIWKKIKRGGRRGCSKTGIFEFKIPK